MVRHPYRKDPKRDPDLENYPDTLNPKPNALNPKPLKSKPIPELTGEDLWLSGSSLRRSVRRPKNRH